MRRGRSRGGEIFVSFVSSSKLLSTLIRAIIGLSLVLTGLVFSAASVQAAPLSWSLGTTSANRWQSVTYGAGLYVAVSDSGGVMTSPDGITWTSRITPTNTGVSIVYGGGQFVVVSCCTSAVMTSPDGITWTTRPISAASLIWTSVTYGTVAGVGIYVAVAWECLGFSCTSATPWRVMTSPNGINWTLRNVPAANYWESVTFANGLFVAVSSSGTNNRAMTSPDGITWTSRTAAVGGNEITYGGGQFVAVGAAGAVMTSPDGITWTTQVKPVGAPGMYGIAYGGGQYVAVAISGDVIMTSPDGIIWTLEAAPSSGSQMWMSIVYANDKFVAVAQSGSFRSMTASAPAPVAPAVTSVSTASGTALGGTSVTITGTNLTGTTGVTFGGTAAVLGAVTSTSVTATTPAHSVGAVSVVVTTPAGSNAANTLFTYTAEAQSISLSPSVTTSTFVGSTISLSSTGSSGSGLKTYSVASGGTYCSISGSTLRADGAGSCTVIVQIAADTTYALETSVAVTFNVSLATQTVTWSPSTSLTLPQSPYAPVSATALGSAPLTYAKVSNTSSTCVVNSSSGELSFTGVGNCVVRASAAATSTYAAGSSDATFTIVKATPVLTWNPTLPLTATAGNETFAAATRSGDGTITYAVTNPGLTGCSLPTSSSRTLSFSGAGSCEVTATLEASDSYLSVTSVKTFAISRDTQALVWNPTLTFNANASPATFDSANTSAGGGAITYAVTTAGAGCSITTASAPLLTFNTSGTCTVTAYAAQNEKFSAASTSQTFTISLATPVLTWAPAVSISKLASPATPSTSATSTSGGAITYVVTNAGLTGCAVDSITGVISFTGLGSCEVTATSATTARYNAGSIAVTFNVVRAIQTITLTATATNILEGGNSTLSSSGYLGSGSRAYSLTSGTGCSLVGVTLHAVTAGSCVLSVAIDQDSTYASASGSLTITVAALAPAPNAGGSSSAHSGTSEVDRGNTGTTSQANTSLDATVGTGAVGTPSEPAGYGTKPSRGVGLPPAPSATRVLPNRSGRTAQVLATLPARKNGVEILATVVEVRDAKGKLIARMNTKVNSADSEVSVTVPYLAEGYSVKVYNVNSVGISTGGSASSGLVFASTLTSRNAAGVPVLFGSRVMPPVYFSAGLANLDAKDKKALDDVAERIIGSTNRIFITGFGRLGGGADEELVAVSKARARNVANYLVSKGVRVWIRYYGAGSFAGTGDWKDRRVEIRSSELAIPRTMVR
jgi:outer membrane protein OmpA-like peptidoglycan-associated protein